MRPREGDRGRERPREKEGELCDTNGERSPPFLLKSFYSPLPLPFNELA